MFDSKINQQEEWFSVNLMNSKLGSKDNENKDNENKDYTPEYSKMTLTDFNTNYIFSECSKWKCYLFGNDPQSIGIIWQPKKGKEPNQFWRWMQYICFGNKWVKEEINTNK